MTHRSLLPHLCAALLAAAGLGAQAPIPQPAPAANPPATSFGAELFRAPIHTQAPDEALGEYGTWASGDAYKASFHDGFVFFPCLGQSYPDNLPWRWRTTSVTVGELALTNGATAPRHAHTDWRYEYDHGAVVEAYDVRPDGVEQTFVLARRPAGAGDLVVTGRVESELTAAAVAPAHQELVFRGPRGEALVRYGHAFAFDATGRRCEVTTAFDGTNVALRVRGEWLAAATFPVTVDPLTSAVAQAFLAPIEQPAVHHHDEAFAYNTMVVHTRVMAAGDRDLAAHLVRDDLPNAGQLIFSDVTAAWSTMLPDVTFVGGADRWVVGFWRHTSTEDRVRVFFHDRDSMTFLSGTVATNHNPTGEHATFLALGGRSHPTIGTNALMTYRSDPFFGNSATTQVWGVVIDAANRVFGARTLLSAGFADAEGPDVNCQLGWGEDGWMVAFQARTAPLDDFDIYVTRVAEQGFGFPPPQRLGPDGLGDKVRPVVQGWDGRYLLAFLQDASPEFNGQHFARNVIVQRFDWPWFGAPLTTQPHRTIASEPDQQLTHLALAHDGASRSHWCLTWDDVSATTPGVAVRRLGYRAAVVESEHLGAASYHGAVAWSAAAHEFVLVNGSFTAPPMVGRRLQYSQAAWHTVYGGSCGPGAISSDSVPLPGSEFYQPVEVVAFAKHPKVGERQECGSAKLDSTTRNRSASMMSVAIVDQNRRREARSAFIDAHSLGFPTPISARRMMPRL